ACADRRRRFIGRRLRVEPADGAIGRPEAGGRRLAHLFHGHPVDPLAQRRYQPPARDGLEVAELMRDVRDAVAFDTSRARSWFFAFRTSVSVMPWRRTASSCASVASSTT